MTEAQYRKFLKILLFDTQTMNGLCYCLQQFKIGLTS
jgi:hypothetical protein